MSREKPLVSVRMVEIVCLPDGTDCGTVKAGYYALAAWCWMRVCERAGRRASLSEDIERVNRAERLLRFIDGVPRP
jgi:hypothetical protein